MSASGRQNGQARKKSRKPPPRWRKYLVQAELELPPPAAGEAAREPGSDPLYDDDEPLQELPWWQQPATVMALAAACLVLLVVAGIALRNAYVDRAAAQAADERVRALTLRAIDSERVLRIAPNPRSWSAAPDAAIALPDPPQLLKLHFPVGYAEFVNFALVIDKVDHGRVLVVERITPDSNRELRIALNSSAFGPGEYRMRLQGYTWRGERVDVGWVRLRVDPPARR
jgi:hypothetical protein